MASEEEDWLATTDRAALGVIHALMAAAIGRGASPAVALEAVKESWRRHANQKISETNSVELFQDVIDTAERLGS